MPNIADALHSTLGSSQLGVARRIASACAELGCVAYIVGGTVRDALLGLPAADLDVTVVSPPDDFLKRVAEILDARVAMVSQFGTAKLELLGASFDLVMARSERYRVPGALPDVTQGSLDDDLARRDFTINCMAASLDVSAWGELIDPHGGQRDLELGLVRTLHDRSFQDDATRILRAARYASRFGFSLEDATGRQLQQSISYLDSISPERRKHELERVFEESNVSGAVNLLSIWGTLNSPGREFRFEATAWRKFAEFSFAGSTERRLIGWGLLSLGFPTSQPREAANRWKLDAEAGSVSADVLRLRDQLRGSSLVGLAPSGRVALLEQYSIEAVRAVSMSTPEGHMRTALDNYLDTLMSVRPALDGHDVLALGVPQGPRVGEVLQMLKNACLDGAVHSKGEETLLVRRYVSKLEE